MKKHTKNFRYKKHCRIFIFNLTKRFFKRFKKPIFFKISTDGKTITYYISNILSNTIGGCICIMITTSWHGVKIEL